MCTRILHGPRLRRCMKGWQLIFYCSSFLRRRTERRRTGDGGGGGRSRLFMILYTRACVCVCVWVIYIQFFFSPRCCGKRHKSVREDIFDRAAAATATADQRRSSSSSVPRRMAIKIINYINNVRSHPSNCITHTRAHTHKRTYNTQSFDVKPIAHKLRNFLRPSSSWVPPDFFFFKIHFYTATLLYSIISSARPPLLSRPRVPVWHYIILLYITSSRYICATSPFGRGVSIEFRGKKIVLFFRNPQIKRIM